MSFTRHSRRFDPCWLFPPIAARDEETSDAPDIAPSCSSDELTSDLTDRDIDLALQQVALEGCCVNPLCEATSGSDGVNCTQLRTIRHVLSSLPAPVSSSCAILVYPVRGVETSQRQARPGRNPR
jgi:hypothetical protein